MNNIINSVYNIKLMHACTINQALNTFVFMYEMCRYLKNLKCYILFIFVTL